MLFYSRRTEKSLLETLLVVVAEGMRSWFLKVFTSSGSSEHISLAKASQMANRSSMKQGSRALPFT